MEYGVTEPEEICEVVLRYCSRRERETIWALPPFRSHDWPRLRSAILMLYDADFDVRHFKVQDLETLARKQRVKSIRNLAQMEEILQVISEGGRIVEE